MFEVLNQSIKMKQNGQRHLVKRLFQSNVSVKKDLGIK